MSRQPLASELARPPVLTLWPAHLLALLSGEPELVKGDLVSWRELYEWITPELGHGGVTTPPLKLAPCSLLAWKEALKRRATREDAPRDIARLAMLLPSIEGELAAEGERLAANPDGTSNKRGIRVDTAWGVNLARALVNEFRAREASDEATV